MAGRLSFVLCFISENASAAEHVDFNSDIRPILSNNCFACHGPDSAARKADLRLDVEKSAIAERDGHAAVVAGKS